LTIRKYTVCEPAGNDVHTGRVRSTRDIDDVNRTLGVLIVIPRDFDRDTELKLVSTLKAMTAPVTAVDIDTDHPFSDSRIALQSAIVRWLASLL